MLVLFNNINLEMNNSVIFSPNQFHGLKHLYGFFSFPRRNILPVKTTTSIKNLHYLWTMWAIGKVSMKSQRQAKVNNMGLFWVSRLQLRIKS